MVKQIGGMDSVLIWRLKQLPSRLIFHVTVFHATEVFALPTLNIAVIPESRIVAITASNTVLFPIPHF